MSSDRRSPDWDIRKGTRNLATLIGAQGAGTLATLVVAWWLTRALGAAGYGGLAAVIIAANVIGFVAVEWTAISLWRYGCEEFVETGRVAATFWTRLSMLVLSLGVVLLASPWLLPLVGEWLDVPPALQLLTLGYLTVHVFWNHVQRTLQAVKLPQVQGLLLACERIVLLVLIIGTAQLESLTVERVAALYLLAPLIPLIIAIRRLWPLIGSPSAANRLYLRKMLLFSLPLVPSSLAASLSAIQIDALFITRFLSLAALGVYSIANQVTNAVMLVPLHIGSLLLSFFVTSRTAKRDELVTFYFAEVLPPLTLVWSAICVSAAVVAGYAIPWMFGPQFESSTSLLWPLMVASALAGPVTMGYGHISVAQSTTYMSTISFGLSAMVNVTLNYLLIPRYGLIGCAWATLIASAANTSVWLFFATKLTATSPRGVMLGLVPPIAGALWVAGSGQSTQGLLVSAAASVVIAVPYLKDVTPRLRHAADSGLPVPSWVTNFLLKAGQP